MTDGDVFKLTERPLLQLSRTEVNYVAVVGVLVVAKQETPLSFDPGGCTGTYKGDLGEQNVAVVTRERRHSVESAAFETEAWFAVLKL